MAHAKATTFIVVLALAIELYVDSTNSLLLITEKAATHVMWWQRSVDKTGIMIVNPCGFIEGQYLASGMFRFGVCQSAKRTGMITLIADRFSTLITSDSHYVFTTFRLRGL